MKIKKFLIILILPLLFIITGCGDNTLEKASKNLNTYDLTITYNDDHTLTCQERLTYRNTTDTRLDNIMFHLYPRSFREGAKSTVVSSLNYDKCYYNGASFGDLTISNLSVNNTDQTIELTGNDEDIVDVKLSSSLAPNESVEIYFEFEVVLPNINHRFGYGDDTINICNFYPIACMYENGEFVIDSYHYNGDPFYSECANYNVTINTPSQYILASTGSTTSTTTSENITTYNISAKAVRDFGIVLSDKFQCVSDNINNVTVNYYYYNNKYPNEAIQAGINSITTFNRLFGEYPYDTLNIVEADFVHGGMEYPGLVLISDAVDVQSDYINVIIHEIAHQWWYGLVGNNEYKYGWLDEGLTEYSTILFYRENPQYNVDTKELIKNTTNSYVTFVDVYQKVFDTVDTSMNRKLNEYNNESEYVYIAYVKGMLLFDSLHEILGKEKFINALQTYFKDNEFKIATPDSLINSFEQSSHTSLREIFNSWIEGKVKIMSSN